MGCALSFFYWFFPILRIHQRRKNHQLRCPNSLTRCLATLLSGLACEQLLLELLVLLRQLLGGLARENTLVFPHVFPNHGSKWWRNPWENIMICKCKSPTKIADRDQSWKIHIKTIQDPYIGLQWFTWDIIWLVVDLPLWKIWVRQWEGLYIPYMKWKIKVMFETTNQIYIH